MFSIVYRFFCSYLIYVRFFVCLGHGECVLHMRSFSKPLLLLGGGGYNVTNTTKCWFNETALAVGVTLSEGS